MEKSPPETQIRILKYLLLQDLIRFSCVSKYFLQLIRDHYWNFSIRLPQMYNTHTVRHILSTYRFQDYCLPFRDDVDQILENCKLIPDTTTLNLVKCELTGKDLSVFTNLSSLNLNYYRGLESDGIVKLCCDRMDPFIKIDLVETHINDQVLEAIARVGCEKLALDNNSMITDLGVQKIVSSGKIRNLSLRGCWRLTDMAFIGLTEIQSLNIRGCRQITDATLKYLGDCRKINVMGCCITGINLAELRNCDHLTIDYHINKERIINLLGYGKIKTLCVYHKFVLYCIKDEIETEYNRPLTEMFPDVKIIHT